MGVLDRTDAYIQSAPFSVEKLANASERFRALFDAPRPVEYKAHHGEEWTTDIADLPADCSCWSWPVYSNALPDHSISVALNAAPPAGQLRICFGSNGDLTDEFARVGDGDVLLGTERVLQVLADTVRDVEADCFVAFPSQFDDGLAEAVWATSKSRLAALLGTSVADLEGTPDFYAVAGGFGVFDIEGLREPPAQLDTDVVIASLNAFLSLEDRFNFGWQRAEP